MMIVHALHFPKTINDEGNVKSSLICSNKSQHMIPVDSFDFILSTQKESHIALEILSIDMKILEHFDNLYHLFALKKTYQVPSHMDSKEKGDH